VTDITHYRSRFLGKRPRTGFAGITLGFFAEKAQVTPKQLSGAKVYFFKNQIQYRLGDQGLAHRGWEAMQSFRET